MINNRSPHDIWAKFVSLNPDKHSIHCYSQQVQFKKYEVNGKWRIYQKSPDDTWIINLSEFPIQIESSWLGTNEEKQLFGGERIAFYQEKEEINGRFDYVFCLTNFHPKNPLKRNREGESSEPNPPPEKIIKMNTTIQEEVICPICLGILTKCATLGQCGHNFCGLCLIGHLRYSSLCPVCKARIISVIKHSAFQNIIEAALRNFPNLQSSNEGTIALQKDLEGNVFLFLDKFLFIGSILNGRAEGQGTLVYPNNEIHQGVWRNSKKEGEGFLIHKDLGTAYVSWSNNILQPMAVIQYINGDWYAGETRNLVLHGKGVLRCQNGDIYEGDWKEGFKEGFGKYYWTNGLEFEGNFERGFKHGPGIMTSPHGNIFEGQWKEEKRDGKGVFRLKNGGQIETMWVNGTPQPEVKFAYSNGNVYEGEFDMENLQKHGKGVLTFRDGSQYEGSWENDKFHGSGKYTCKKYDQVYHEIWEHGVLKYSLRFDS